MNEVKKIGQSWKGKFGKDHCISEPVKQLSMDGELVNQFESIIQAQRATGILQPNISACLKGKRKHAGGYRWVKVST